MPARSPVAGGESQVWKSVEKCGRVRGGLIGAVPAVTAILDRFLHHAEIIEITGRSYRLKDKARENRKQVCKEHKEGVQ